MHEMTGKRIVLTKSARDGDAIEQALIDAGAEVLSIPLIEIEPFEDPDKLMEVFKGIATYDWIVYTSINGVKYYFESFFRAFGDIRAFGPARIACVGEQTAEAVRDFHLEVDLVPEIATGEGLAEALVETGSTPSAYVLWVSGDKVNKKATQTLEGKGEAIIDVFTVYRSKLRVLDKDPIARDFRSKGADAILFSSPSAIDSFAQQATSLAIGKNAKRPKSISIGPVTSEAMRAKHLPIDKECKQPTPEAVVAAVKDILGA
jgi:uroporphyrinogen-III synthase